MIISSKLMSVINQKLSWLSTNAQVLAQNVSQSDTPGAQRYELKQFQEVMKLNPTNRPIDYKKLVVNTGNPISREEEMLKLNENLSMHQLGTNIYKRHLALVRIILGRSSGG